MLFHTLDFAIFLPIVFALYWFAFGRSIRLQNLLLVAASYVFYGWWDYRFLSLFFASTAIDYLVGRGLTNEERPERRKMLLWTSIGGNLGMLGFFKYYNFFVESFVSSFKLLGTDFHVSTMSIVLPVGISFYTFQTLSYSIDVYRRKMVPTRNFIAFAAFVSFFPQLVAGPIERATNLLPQFFRPRTFEYAKAVDGLRQILWGLFKKVVIADNCATYANAIFANSSEASGSTLVVGVVFFAFQIYCDFSGYSDIAIGVSRLFGFDLMRNFAYPYFSRDIAEFWRRWHISLSTWFRDYLYIPLGGSRGSTARKIFNTFVIFTVSGFWHGANWTFIVWGALNAIYFLPLLIAGRNRNNMEIVAHGRLLPSLSELGHMIATFAMTCFAWIFFRADNIDHAVSIISRIFSSSLLSIPSVPHADSPIATAALVAAFMIIEWHGRAQQYAIAELGKRWPFLPRYALYYVILVMVLYYGGGDEHAFIYFQF